MKRKIVYKKVYVFKSKFSANLLYGNTEKSCSKAQETDLVSTMDWCSGDTTWTKSLSDF